MPYRDPPRLTHARAIADTSAVPEGPAERARVTGRTALYAIVGDPVAQVGAPARFNRLCEERGHDGVMAPVRLAAGDLATGFEGLRRIGNLRGIVFTIPHKIAMAGLVDDLAPGGRLVGAVNAARPDADGRWIGDMFDGRGCVAAARAAGHDLAGRAVRQIGAGGVGRAIAFAFAEAGIERLAVSDAVPGRAESLAAAVERAFPRVRAAAGVDAAGWDTVVNASPLGMRDDDPPPVPADALAPDMLAVDVVLRDRPTPFLAAAAAAGAATQDGRAMLEAQIELLADFFRVPAGR